MSEKIELVNLIGKGAQADVYEYNGRAIKLYRKGYDKTNIFYEAMIGSIIEKTGLPVPSIKKVFETNGSWAIEMDLINGITLMELMKKESENTEKYISDMVKLQIKVQSYGFPDYFSLKKKLYDRINSLKCIDENIKEKLLNKLNSFADDNKLCHGDFHPLNIIKQDETLHIIDWVDSASGNPEADICRSYLLFYLHLNKIAELYIDSYCKITQKCKEDIMKWLPVIAAARLSDNFTIETERLHYIINQAI
jgi:tRNA A-37 threonylcarbamoyl transferase component Bud32